MFEVKIFTDGACSGNPGPGGWGVIIQAVENGEVIKTKEISGGAAGTTNNRMELKATIEALNALERPAKLTLTTDSLYVRDGITSWLTGWKRNGWKTLAKKPVKNKDLWRALDEASARHDITWVWTKGHADHAENERADALAREGMEPFKK